ncbi:MAG: TolC family protein [Pseudomonadota bacterium]|nr:TolC family protein [Pseudomonadota bacterium]
MPALGAAAPLSLDQALTLAVQRSEAAHAARASTASLAEAARAAGQLPDPMLRAGVENLPITGADRFSTTRDFQTMKRVGISQEWLSSDKRIARESAAMAAVEREAIQPQVAEADARLQTAMAYLDAWYAEAALKLTGETQHHAHEELEAARARLASATGGSAEVLALTAARGIAEDESDEVRQLRATAVIALQRWVGVTTEELTAVASLSVPSEQDYVDAHPSVVSLQRDIEVARQSAAVASNERTPNWTWEISYGQRSGYSDMVSVAVSIPLQVAPAQRQDRETAAKLALVDKAEAELAEALRAAASEYQTLTSDIQRLTTRIERYRGGVAEPARQRTAAAMAAYRSNQMPLSGLFEARHAEVEAQRRLLGLERDLARTRAQLAFRPLAGVHP